MPSKRSRERQLAKLAARRAAERKRKRRQRILAISIATAVFVGGFGFLAFALLRSNPKGKPSAKSSPSVSPSASPSASPTASAAAVACGGKVPAAASRKKPSYSKPPKMTINKKRHYIATFQTSCGTFKVRFDPKTAPNTVNSLVFLIQHHFYDGLTFHRIARNFVIQGGDPSGNGSGGPGYSTVDPPPANAQYPVGTVAMAKTASDPVGTAGSQFFVVTGSTAQTALAPGGKGQYAIVGHVVSGLGAVNKIAALPIAGGSQDGPPE